MKTKIKTILKSLAIGFGTIIMAFILLYGMVKWVEYTYSMKYVTIGVPFILLALFIS